MSTRHLILISTRPADHELATSIARAASLSLAVVQEADQLIKHLYTGQESVVLWDIDNPETLEPGHSIAPEAVYPLLSGGLSPQRTFLLADQGLNHQPELTQKSPSLKHRTWQHTLMRKIPALCAVQYGRILSFAFDPRPQGLAPFFSPQTRIQKISLTRSEQRKAAADAMESFLSKLGLENRIASRAAQATDELLMNAIFDAAVDASGNRTRNLLDRKARFDFPPSEPVTIEAAEDESWVGLCATDRFGSVSIDSLFKYLGQNFHDLDYTPRKSGPGAGLGIYGIVESGFSLMHAFLPGKRTDSYVFIPKVKRYKDFRLNFHFTACFKA